MSVIFALVWLVRCYFFLQVVHLWTIFRLSLGVTYRVLINVVCFFQRHVHCLCLYGLSHRQQNYFGNTAFSLYMKIPFRGLSRWSGKLHSANLPRWLHRLFIGLYVYVYKCKVHEAVIDDLSEYRNLSEFFRRTLKPELRPVDHRCLLTSPADGSIVHQGRISEGVLEQVKGVTYSLKGFLGPLDHSDIMKYESEGHLSFEERILHHPGRCALYYSIIYLGPADYHGFHSPTNWGVTLRRHFPGELFSVSSSIAHWLQGLFNFNERVVFFGHWQHGFFSMAAVGATNVGSIRVYFDEELVTNKPECIHGSYDDKTFAQEEIALKKGQRFGEFNIGSTIVLIFEAPNDFQFSANIGQKIQYGQGFGK